MKCIFRCGAIAELTFGVLYGSFYAQKSDLCLYNITHTTHNMFKLGAKLKIFIQEAS